MRSDATLVAVAALALVACGGFERGKPSDGGCDEQTDVYVSTVYPLLDESCRSCHSGSGPASGTAFVLTGDADTDYDGIRALVDPSAPDASPLLMKGSGQGHAGGAPLPAGSQDYDAIRAWIQDGAPRGGGDCGDGSMDAGPQPDAMVADAASDDAAVDDAAGNDMDTGPSPDDAMVEPDAERDARIDAEPSDTGAPDADEVDAMPDAAPSLSFENDVRALLLDDCEACHREGGVAATTGLLYGDGVDDDLASTLMFVDLDEPSGSVLLAKARGEAHGGGERFAEDSQQYATILAWIEGGASP